MRRMAVAAAMAVACVLGSGCYRYEPARVDRLVPDTEVRARLSPDAAERLRVQLRSDGRVVEGRFVGRAGDRLLVEVPAVSELRGMRLETLHQRIDLAPGEIVEVEVRALDRGRTYLLIGAGAAVVAAVVIAQIGPGEGSPTPDGGQPPGELRIPVRIPLPFGR